MNDLDEFAEITLAIFLGLTLLIWLLTYLERTLLEPAPERRSRDPHGEGTADERVHDDPSADEDSGS